MQLVFINFQLIFINIASKKSRLIAIWFFMRALWLFFT